MNKIIVSKEVNPYYNLALEEELFYSVKEEETLFYLWQNEKTVVIGRNQNPWLECNIDYLEQEKIYLARRLSGGGAVFHDLGNLNFTFITRVKNSNHEKQIKVLKCALEKLGIKLTTSVRNDLLIQGKKFSGHAFFEEGDYYFHHGTLMVDVDFNLLTHVLTPSQLKLQSKGIKSVKSRVINLKQVEDKITLDILKQCLIESFKACYGEVCSVQEVSFTNYTPKTYKRYQSQEWIYGETPSFDVIIEEKTQKGLVQVGLEVKNGRIKKMDVFTDALVPIDDQFLREKWMNCIVDEKQIRQMILQYI